MLEQIRRFLGCCALAALTLGACQSATVAPAGSFEVVGALERGAACDAAGELRLQAVDTRASLLVSGSELCAGAPLRRELPPGLYTLSWQSTAQAAVVQPRDLSLLRGPAVVSLLSGQLTRLRVQIEALPAAAPSAETASSEVGAMHAEPSSTCGLGLQGSGAS